MAWSFVLELDITCGPCRAPVTVPDICSAVTCARCKTVHPLPAELWTGIFPPAASAEVLRRLARGGVEYRPQDVRASRAVWIRRAPFCPACGIGLDEAPVLARLAAGRFGCPGCGRPMAVRRADDLCRAIRTDALAVLTQAPDDDEASTHRTPIVPSCSSCGGALLADGSKRTVACRRCGAENVLPEAVWSQFHPVEVPRPFFLLCAHGRETNGLPAK
jgi:ribosomal protein S27AE